ncbi:MAG: helix-hairpin-helix domain-containing protein, partial [Agathobacter sp.]|nr:helix-hairpin-helix domain-containing protein [Agathobacter sp.]
SYGVFSMKSRMAVDEKSYYSQLAEMRDSFDKLCDYQSARGVLRGERAAKIAGKAWGIEMQGETNTSNKDIYLPSTSNQGNRIRERNHTYGLTHSDRHFVPAGQSTQMIIGATGETDYQIMSVSEALYNRFELKRVFYSAFVNVNQDANLPALIEGPPLLREHRLYQADFLLRFYGFKADELLSEKRPNFNEKIDPKCDWAVRHLEQFPVEINKADYYTLLRVPGIGTKSAKRIIAARKHAKLDFADIKKMGVVLKRALYFITCNGRMMYHTPIEEGYITRQLIYSEKPNQLLLPNGGVTHYEQMSLFDFAV